MKYLLTILLLLHSAVAADLRLPGIFGDHMVLQQGKELPVWGWAEPGATVSVVAGDQKGEAVATEHGTWQLSLSPLTMSTKPVTLTVSSGDETTVLTDVLVGDVWLCSGQSNMAMGVGAMKKAKEIVAQADHPQLRLFIVQRQVSFEVCDDLKGEWVVCSPEGIMLTGGWKGFSAVGYFFGKALLEADHAPIGLIGSYVGGSGIHAWSSLESLQTLPDPKSDAASRLALFQRTKANLPKLMAEHAGKLTAWEAELATRNAQHKQALDAWKAASAKARAAGEAAPVRPQPGPLSRRPLEPTRNFSYATVLYNGMLAPLMPFAITGAIWYQGEAEAYPQKAAAYEQLLNRMITDWRNRWGQGDFPFIVVQLPNLKSNKDTWPIVRESQRQAVAATPNAGMVVTIDVGDPDDLHPAFKQPIGDRLALVARHLVYGEDIVSSGPMIRQASGKAQRIVLTFDHVGSGLVAKNLLSGFEVAGPDGVYVPATASIAGEAVHLTWQNTDLIPESVRYAWAPNPAATLYNQNGLPASPFVIATQP